MLKVSFLEGIKEAKKYFISKLGEEKLKYFNDLEKIDPTPQKKYMVYIVKQFVDNNVLVERKLLEKIEELIKTNKIKGLNVYDKVFSDYKELKKYVDSFKTKEEELYNIMKEETEIVFENDKFVVLIPLSHKASKILGSPYWCVSYESSLNWDRYLPYFKNKTITLFFVLKKNKYVEFHSVMGDKFAIGFYNNVITDLENFKEKINERIEEAKRQGVRDAFGNVIRFDESFDLIADDMIIELGGRNYFCEFYNDKRDMMSTIKMEELLNEIGFNINNLIYKKNLVYK